MLKKLCTALVLLAFVWTAHAQDENKKTEDDQTKRPSWSEGLPERQKAADLNTNEFKPEINSEIELDMSEFGLKEKPKIEIELPISNDIGAKNPNEVVANISIQNDERNSVINQTQPELTPTKVEPPAEIEIVNEVVENQPSEVVTDNENLVPNTNTAVTSSASNVDVVDSVVTDDEVSVNANNLNQSASQQIPSGVAEDDEVATDAIPDDEIVTQAEKVAFEWKIVKRTPVEYPPRAAVQNLEGWVDVEITINPAGEVISASAVKYSRKGRIFGKNAVQAVNNWLFEPPSNVGINSNMTRIYKIEFDL